MSILSWNLCDYLLNHAHKPKTVRCQARAPGDLSELANHIYTEIGNYIAKPPTVKGQSFATWAIHDKCCQMIEEQ